MRILIVEDEPKIAKSLKRGLEQESYAVDVAYDADEGLASALASDYDVIVLDRMLPGSMEGLGVCKAIREEKKQTPILMLTARGQIRDRVEGLNAGADDYLVKPFSFEELLARVRALLRRPQTSSAPVLQVAELTLDPAGAVVKRSGKSINLSQKEFALLEFLMRNADRVVSKDKIINHVWDFDADVLPNIVEVYVGYLRNKVDRPFPKLKPVIQTVRGFGYKLKTPE
jgi:DNA-binding response OmpR family regulator